MFRFPPSCVKGESEYEAVTPPDPDVVVGSRNALAGAELFSERVGCGWHPPGRKKKDEVCTNRRRSPAFRM